MRTAAFLFPPFPTFSLRCTSFYTLALGSVQGCIIPACPIQIDACRTGRSFFFLSDGEDIAWDLRDWRRLCPYIR